MKNYTKEKFLEILRKTDFPDYTTFTRLNKAFQHFISKLSEVIDLLCLSKKLKLRLIRNLGLTQQFVEGKNFSKMTKTLVWRQRKIIFDQQKWLFRKLYLRKRHLFSRKN